jgi:hypothetical protein
MCKNEGGKDRDKKIVVVKLIIQKRGEKHYVQQPQEVQFAQ